MKPFPCTSCGACCRHVDLSEQTRFLDRGDGVCRIYEEATRLCTEYAHRPEICRVDVQYQMRYQEQMSWDDFSALNSQACMVLQQIT